MIDNHPIDLRSDTVTQPPPEMRKAMHDAPLGDDYYRDDPTVRRLEEKSAALLGKEAALLVLSGTMGNLVSLMALARPGDSVLVADNAHVYLNEAGGMARIAGLTSRAVAAPDGFITPKAAEAALLVTQPINPITTVLCLENTNNAAGGRVVPVDATDTLCRFAAERDLKVHLDGARLFNAAVALGVRAARLARDVDSVTFCLTKGLACPAGSIVAGSEAFIAEARICRQALGGGMRQAGCFAAAGIVALDRMVERLAEDHDHARLLARLLAGLGLPVDPARVDSNMVFFEVPEELGAAADLVQRIRAAGVLLNPPKGRRVRLVTHYGIEEADVHDAARRIGGCLAVRGAMPAPIAG